MGFHVVCEDVPEDGLRLCQDGLWRRFAGFGTYSDCVKVYKSLGHAQRKARAYTKLIGHAEPLKLKVVSLNPGESMDACGRVFNDNRVGA